MQPASISTVSPGWSRVSSGQWWPLAALAPKATSGSKLVPSAPSSRYILVSRSASSSSLTPAVIQGRSCSRAMSLSWEARRISARSCSSFTALARSMAREALTKPPAAPRSIKGSRKRAGRFLSTPRGSRLSTAAATRSSTGSASEKRTFSTPRSSGTVSSRLMKIL